MKIVVNRCYGGYGLSKKAYEFLGLKWTGDDFGPYSVEQGYAFSDYEERTNPDLVRCVETLGEDASGDLAQLEVIEIPDDVDWEIRDYDGWETVEEKHRSW